MLYSNVYHLYLDKGRLMSFNKIVSIIVTICFLFVCIPQGYSQTPCLSKQTLATKSFFKDMDPATEDGLETVAGDPEQAGPFFSTIQTTELPGTPTTTNSWLNLRTLLITGGILTILAVPALIGIPEIGTTILNIVKYLLPISAIVVVLLLIHNNVHQSYEPN